MSSIIDTSLGEVKAMAGAVYGLFFARFFLPITALVGVILAHISRGKGGAALDSHYQFQIRTFWIGLLMLIVGSIGTVVLIGWLVIAAWAVWTLVRVIAGVVALSHGKPIENPASLLFG